MSTFKASLKVLVSKKLMIMIYVVWLCLMMFGLSWSIIQNLAHSDNSTTFASARPEVSVVNRDDDDSDALVRSLNEFLAKDCDLVDVGGSDEELQTAVASNYTDLIVIVPQGFADRFAQTITDGTDVPELDTVVSFTGAYGSLAQLQVNNFLNLTRTEALAQHGAGGSAITATSLTTAAQHVVDALDGNENSYPTISVADDPHSATDAQESARVAFVTSVKMGVYPLLAAMLVVTALTMNSFADANVRRRLYAAPQRSGSMMLQQFAACGVFAVVIAPVYLAISLALPALAGLPVSGLAPASVAMCAGSLVLYALVAVASGFMVSMLAVNAVAVNAIANVFGLLVMFTSGMAFPIDMMPRIMIMIGKLLPGWWYCQSITAAGGASNAVDAGAWLANNGLVLLFGIAFICLGLAFSKLRRSRPNLQASATTQLAEA